jgi:tetratricopeptide (TPR) repeat protein
VAFSPDGKVVLTGSYDHTARLWSAASGKPIASPLRHNGMVRSVAFSPDGKTVITGSDDSTARLWDASTGQPIGPPLHHDAEVPILAFSPDGKIVVTGSWDKTARLWDATTGQPVGSPMWHESYLRAVTFSPDGKTLLTGSYDKTARLWDAATGQPIGTPIPHPDDVFAVAFSPDGKSMLTGSHDTVRLWDAATRLPLGAPMRHQSPLWSAAFSPDGKTILTTSYDSKARVWDAATSRPLGPPLRHEGWVYHAAFSPDGKTVGTGSFDQTARLWDMSELPDEPERVSVWLSKVTALELDAGDELKQLGKEALEASRRRLESLGGPPLPKPRWSLDPIVYGIDPAARVREWIRRGRWAEAEAAFDEALRARPLYALLWAERSRYHASQDRADRAIDDLVQAALVCWNDPKLTALIRSDATFRGEALEEILQMQSADCRSGSEVWRARGRRRAALSDWAVALREFATPATRVSSLAAHDLPAQACLLRLAGDDVGANRFDLDVRRLPERMLIIGPEGSPMPDRDAWARLWVRLLGVPPVDPTELVRSAEKYVTNSQGEGKYAIGAALLRAGRLDEAILRFEESLAIEREWPNSGLNAYGLALAHHRFGHPDKAREWLERAELWLNSLDRVYAAEAPGILSGQPPVPVSFEFWVYAQVLRREIAGPILDASFPSDPFAR